MSKEKITYGNYPVCAVFDCSGNPLFPNDPERNSRPCIKGQAIVPVVLGAFSLILSFLMFLAIGYSMNAAGLAIKGLPRSVHSILAAFLMAGLPEEITKLAMMLLTLLLFRSRVRNIYEVILIGAAAGFGFTLFEEFLYGSDSGLLAIMRLFTIASHMIFGIIMAKHLGTAGFIKRTGRGSAGAEVARALIIPTLIHTLFDASTGTNMYLSSEKDTEVMIALIISLLCTVILFVLQFVVLKDLKRNTEKYCEMAF